MSLREGDSHAALTKSWCGFGFLFVGPCWALNMGWSRSWDDALPKSCKLIDGGGKFEEARHKLTKMGAKFGLIRGLV